MSLTKKTQKTKVAPQSKFKRYGYMVGRKFYKSYATAAAEAAGGGASVVLELHTNKWWAIHQA